MLTMKPAAVETLKQLKVRLEKEANAEWMRQRVEAEIRQAFKERERLGRRH